MYSRYLKRLFDLIFALILTPLIIPILMICGLIIKLEDRGPVFYLGNRLGKNQNIFRMYKLRTMKVNAQDIRNPDGSTYNSANDPRLLKCGRIFRKFSFDELPQIFNVLKGDMSFIGPRPDLPDHINYYEGEEIRKLDVLPGISGYNQAYYRNATQWKDRLKNDVYYVNNITFLLDLKILFKTIRIIIFREGVYTNIETKSVEGVTRDERA